MKDDEIEDASGAAKNAANAISSWRSSLGALAVLFYLMSVVQWREHFGLERDVS